MDANGFTTSQFTPTDIGNANPDGSGGLVDKTTGTGTYTGSFDGTNLTLKDANGHESTGSWIQGSSPTGGITGGGALSSNFDFTFSDHGNGQSLHATFIYAGTFSEAQSELYNAGYSFSAPDQMFNFREMLANPNAENYRTPGDAGTGTNSGHFLVNHTVLSLLPKYSVPTTGSVHTGETNPNTSLRALFQHLTNEQ